MTKTEIKQQAQDAIMQRLADSLLIADEQGDDAQVIDEMRRQAARIGKLFGYRSWPGIGQIA
jgi:hypothetical protein